MITGAWVGLEEDGYAEREREREGGRERETDFVK